MTIELNKETEQNLEDYLMQQGLESDALSDAMNTVVQEAIEDYLFRQMMRNAQERNKNLNVAETEELIEDVIREDRHKQRQLKQEQASN